MVTSAATSAASAGASLSARTRAPIRLAATPTRAPARPAAQTASATAAPRAGAGGAGAVDGLAARAGGGTVDTRWNTGQQLGVAYGAKFVGSADGRKRFRRRICRQETRTWAGGHQQFAARAGGYQQFAASAGPHQFACSAGHAVTVPQPRPPLGAT